MLRTFALLVLVALTCGCAYRLHYINRPDSGRLVAGHSVDLKVDAVVIECDVFDGVLVGGRTRKCIQPATDTLGNKEKVLATIPAGTSLVIKRLKFVNSFEQITRYAYLQGPGGEGVLVAHEYDLFRLLGMDRGPTWTTKP